MSALVLAVYAAGFALLAASFRVRSPYGWLVVAAGGFLMLAGALATRAWIAAVIDAVCLLAALWMWWRNRRGRGRFRALLSGKYARVRDAMARTLRDRRVPRPALAPGRA